MKSAIINSNRNNLGSEQFCWISPDGDTEGLICSVLERSGLNVIHEFKSGQPVLFGNPSCCIGFPAKKVSLDAGMMIAENEVFLGGVGGIEFSAENLEESVSRIHRILFSHLGGKKLFRIWYFVPEINKEPVGGIENYKSFCRARSIAFEDYYGDEVERQFTACSATGSQGAQLIVCFLATLAEVENWENPEQVPAYKYPAKYGPRSPSFSRASLVKLSSGEWVFISGTAAIRASESCFANDFEKQLELTLHNIDITLNEKGLSLAGSKSDCPRHFRVFLRNARDLPALRSRFKKVLAANDHLTVVNADICRAELKVEIELSMFRRA